MDYHVLIDGVPIHQIVVELTLQRYNLSTIVSVHYNLTNQLVSPRDTIGKVGISKRFYDFSPLSIYNTVVKGLVEDVFILRYDVLHSRLVYPLRLTMTQLMGSLNPVVSSNYDACSVCHEMTIGHLVCKHHICLLCYSKLVKAECPMCRTSIKSFCNKIHSEVQKN